MEIEPECASANRRRSEVYRGTISNGELYRAEQAKKRLGIGDWAWRRMRRDGLRVHYVGGKAFVLGDDIIKFIKAQGQATAAVSQQAEQQSCGESQ